jgi:hypothetical protein
MTALLPEDEYKVKRSMDWLYTQYRPRECFLFLVRIALDLYEKYQKNNRG